MDFILSAFADEAGSTFDEQISACRENGVDHIEIRGMDGRSVTGYSTAEAKELAKKLGAKGMKLSAIGSPSGKIGIEDDFAPHLDAFKHTCELANILSAENIRLFSFFIPKDEDAENYFEPVTERLFKFADAAKTAGVRCCHENEKDIYGDNAPRCLKLLNSLNGGLDCIFDFANFIQVGQETLPAYDLLKDRIKYFHIKDALNDGGVVPAGKGNGHIREILGDFSSKKGSCFLTVEPHLAVFKGFENLERENVSLQTTFTYRSGREAFSAAVQAIRSMLSEMGYNEDVTASGWKWKPAD